MSNNSRKKFKIQIILFSIIIVIIYLFMNLTRKQVMSPEYEIKLEASQTMEKNMSLIREIWIKELVENPSLEDINETGLIGLPYTKMTTTLGSIESKRTSTNPNFAAVFVDMFTEIGLKPGDVVACNFSSSFPSLNLAVLSAMEAMDLKGIVMTSIGASSYGANRPEMTYIDMEKTVTKSGLLSNSTSYYSKGGYRDTGTDIDADILDSIEKRYKLYGIEYIGLESVEENIHNRYNTYGEVNAFVNVGGNILGLGIEEGRKNLSGGIIEEIPVDRANDLGLIQLFDNDNVPVINVLDIKDLAMRYGLPIDPVPLPKAGEGNVYYEIYYNKFLPLVGILILTISGSIYIIRERKRKWA